MLARLSKVTFRTVPPVLLAGANHPFAPDLLKLADETDMDVLNSCMETMVECYHAELMPVAGQLTARLVRIHPISCIHILIGVLVRIVYACC